MNGYDEATTLNKNKNSKKTATIVTRTTATTLKMAVK
jgi:hypothetical protein